MIKFKAKYRLGQEIIIAGEIKGWIESITFVVDNTSPQYGVCYWFNGGINRETVTDKDIQGLE